MFPLASLEWRPPHSHLDAKRHHAADGVPAVAAEEAVRKLLPVARRPPAASQRPLADEEGLPVGVFTPLGLV